MKYYCVWIIDLPFRIRFQGKDTGTIQFTIDNTDFEFYKKEGNKYYDEIHVKIEINEDEVLNQESELLRMIEINNKYIIEVGNLVNKFIDSYNRYVNPLKMTKVFNGYDFSTGKEMKIINDKNEIIGCMILSSNSRMIPTNLINENILKRIIIDTKMGHNDFTEDCIRYSKSFLENGFFDMAVINLSMACEHFIKKHVFSKTIKVQDLNYLDGEEIKGYVEKFFNAGLKIIKGISLKEYNYELYESILNLTDIRNEIAHGRSILDMDDFSNFNSEDIYEHIDDLIIDTEKVISWIKSEPNTTRD